MNIGEFSNKTSISIDTLRYYNKIGLLIPSRDNNRRIYNEDDLEKAIAINKLKSLSFTLNEIKTLFVLEETIENNEKITDTALNSINLCLNIMNNKMEDILKQQQDLLVIKTYLEKIILKTTKLLENPELLKYIK